MNIRRIRAKNNHQIQKLHWSLEQTRQQSTNVESVSFHLDLNICAEFLYFGSDLSISAIDKMRARINSKNLNDNDLFLDSE